MRAALHVYRYVSTLVGWIVFVTGCVVWGTLVIPIALILTPLAPGIRPGFRRLTSRALGLYIATLGFLRVEVRGRQRRCSTARVVVANHQSWLDPIVLLGLEPGLSGPAQRYLYRVPILGRVLDLLGFVDASPDDAEAFVALRDRARKDPDVALLFLPEGTRSRTGRMGPFRRGAFRVAIEAGLPLQPIIIDGLFDVLPPGALIARAPGRAPVVVSYLEPVQPPPANEGLREATRALTEEVRGQMVAELERLRRERAGEGASRSGVNRIDRARTRSRRQ
jgi:1-acyl-sn-glycerol-3-phosphate acyltransferase